MSWCRSHEPTKRPYAVDPFEPVATGIFELEKPADEQIADG